MIRVDLRVERPGFVLDVAFASDARALGVFGGSGAGKSTLLAGIAGLVRTARARVEIDGTTLADSARSLDVPAHRRRLGVVFQDGRLFPHLSVRGNLRYGAPEAGDSSLQEVVELLELSALVDRRPHELSGGERQRVALGRALLTRPRALLLDEPLSSLDRRLKRQILPYLRRVREATTVPIVFVSHDLAEMQALVDEMLIIDAGTTSEPKPISSLLLDERAFERLRDDGLANVLSAVVVAHEGPDATVLRLGGVQGPDVRAARVDASAGTEVRLRVAPSEVALALQPLQGISIRNQLAGTVRRLEAHARATLVEIDVGVPIVAELSHGSVRDLGIGVGQAIVCLVKSQALRVAEPS
ncbi:MAG: molybdenum ABC transporter ATP-binding protein [Phycisphaerae bacterium]|nr:molybdenum ABC transporter ATP-binding protein [Phycisphaerae bacterium]